MVQASRTEAARNRMEAGSQPTGREQWALVAAGTVLIGGVFLDGWAHSTRLDELESFLTPWHGVIFLGYLLVLAVVVAVVRSRILDGQTLRTAVPAGWRGAVVGVGLFAAGFLGDGVWHTIFGIEADLEALLSPTHLLMLAGGLGVLGAPISAQWRFDEAASWRVLGPTLAASTLIVAALSFFVQWVWPVRYGVALTGYADFVAEQGVDAADTLTHFGRTVGVAGYMVYAALMVAPVLVLSRRWSLPPGSVVLLTMVPLVATLIAFDLVFAWVRLIPALVGALAVEDLLRRWAGSMNRWKWRVIGAGFAFLVPALDMVVLESRWDIAWPLEFVAGSALFAGFVGYGLSILAFPPPVPAVVADQLAAEPTTSDR